MAAVSCRADWVELISDNYKSRHCGETTEPWSIITESHLITVIFSSNYAKPFPGFLAIWSATTAPPTYPTSTGCESCTFPFVFGDGTFDTCINVENVDTQPWCLDNRPPPTDEGIHIIYSPKIFCFDSDSSCPSTPPQAVITSPEYPLNYPNNVDQVKLLDVIYQPPTRVSSLVTFFE